MQAPFLYSGNNGANIYHLKWLICLQWKVGTADFEDSIYHNNYEEKTF